MLMLRSVVVGEFAEAPFAVVSAHAGVSRAAERHTLDHHVDADFVDAPAAVLLRLHHAVCPFFVFGIAILPASAMI